MQTSREHNVNVMQYISANKVCELLEISKTTLRRKVAMKEIECIRVNNAMIFTAQAIDAYIRRNSSKN